MEKSTEQWESFLNEQRVDMTWEELVQMQNEFKKEEKRDPKEKEIKVLDTYWSDHCRHTTFETYLKDIKIECGNLTENIQKSIEEYLDLRKNLGREEKPITYWI